MKTIILVGYIILGNSFLGINCLPKLAISQLTWDFLVLEDEIWKFIIEYPDKPVNKTNPDLIVLEKFHNFDKAVHKVPNDIEYGLKSVRHTHSYTFLYFHFRTIHDLYEKFRRLQNSCLQKEDKDEADYCQQVMISHMVDDVLHFPNVNKTLMDIYPKILTKNSDIYKIYNRNKYLDFYCKNHGYSPKQTVFNLYNVMALTELKAYIMMQYAYMAVQLGKEPGKVIATSALARKQFEIHVNQSMTTFRGVLKPLPRIVFRCDPKRHIYGVTYTKLTQLLQGHIEMEGDMSSINTCSDDCWHGNKRRYSKSYGCYEAKSFCHKRKPCNGRLVDCEYVGYNYEVCISPDSSTRRMDYVQYTGWGGFGDSGAWGQKTKSCSFAGAYSWLRGVFWCHYCFCLCDEDGPKSDRYFNLRPVKSDIANNRVVTGMRIIKSNRIIHLQIQEGKLLPNRQIDNSTVRWVPVDNYTLYQKDIKDKIDFYKMDYDRRAIYLDNLKANRTDQVLTGVRFMSTTNGPKFAIELTGFDFNTGILSNETYKLNISSKSRTYLETGGLVSTLTTDNEPVWGNSPFLKFSSSSKKYDVAQTTLPFFDSQPVTSNPPVPLIGAGLYLKRTNYNYGGFIGPKLWTFGFDEYLESEFPKMVTRNIPEEENSFEDYSTKSGIGTTHRPNKKH